MAVEFNWDDIIDEEEPEPFWREVGVSHNLPRNYGVTNNYFTLKIHANGRFTKCRGHRMYTGGWVKYLDYCEGDRLTLIWLMHVLRQMGMTGICFLYYKKPMATLDNGLVHMKTQKEVDDMIEWAKGVKEIRIYILHPSRKLTKSLLLGEMYESYISKWPKPILKEISDEEYERLILGGWEKSDTVGEPEILSTVNPEEPLSNTTPLLLTWHTELDEGGEVMAQKNVQELDDVAVEGGEGVAEKIDNVAVRGGEGEEEMDVRGMENVEVEGDQGDEEVDVQDMENVEVEGGGDEEMDDFDWETFTFMREDNFGEDYEPLHEDDVEEENAEHENAYTEIEDGLFDDLGPVLNDIGPLPEYSYEHSDQLREFSGSEDDDEEEEIGSGLKRQKRMGGLEYNREVHLKNPIIVPNMVFGSAGDFRELIREYAVTTKKPLKFVKNEPKRIRVKCIQEDCDFFVFCSAMGKTKDLSIKTMNDNHTCGTSMKIPTISVKWLAKKYVNKIRRTPKKILKAFIGDIFDELKVEISISTAFRAIKAAGYLMYGSENQQFASLWSYAKEMLDTMPGSTVIIKQDEQKFQRVYVCPAPLKMGFLVGCRKFLCLDGCFLKGSFKGQILAAVALDADNGIYPIAWAVVEVENTDSWTWFIRLMKEDLVMDREPDSWILMTDQQKGLEIAIQKELPEAEHRLCVKHLHANWSKRFPGTKLKEMMWKCARAANEPYFERKMHQLKNVTVEGYEALRNIDPRKWSRFAFRPRTNCPELVNNWAEAFNVFIIKARDQPIITMLNTIYHAIMTRIVDERAQKLKCKGIVGPRIEEVLEKREENLYDFIVRASGSPRYEVTSAHHTFVVDLEKKECSCGLWQLGGTPCMHAISVYKSKNKDPRKYVHTDYQLSTWFKIYEYSLEPLRGPMFWTTSPYPTILPPDIRVLPGRPKRNRRKDASERREQAEKQAENQSQKQPSKQQDKDKGVFKASRKGAVIHCKICGGVGHNTRTCPHKVVDAEPAPSRSKRTNTASSQPATSSTKKSKK